MTRTTIVFDIGGTLLDEPGSITADCVAVLEQPLGREAAERFSQRWRDRLSARFDGIVAGDESWSSSEDLRRESLVATLAEHDLPADGAEFDRLVDTAHRLRAFEGAAQGLDRLAAVARVVGVTNTDLDASSDSCAAAGLRWHGLISTEQGRTYKPRPEAYVLAEELLGVDPPSSLFVAAHPWDLRAAAERGYRTVYLPRPGAAGPETDDRFDHTVQTVEEIVALVEGPPATIR